MAHGIEPQILTCQKGHDRSALGFPLSLALPRVLTAPCAQTRLPSSCSPRSTLQAASSARNLGATLLSPPPILGQPFLTHQVQGISLGTAMSVDVPWLYFPTTPCTSTCAMCVFSPGLKGT